MAGQARQRAVAIAITAVAVATAGMAMIAPAATAQIPGPSPQTLNATGLFNSRLLPPDVPDSPGGSPPPAAVRSFTFVVPAAGNYPYYCILHATSGMSAAISVT